MAVKKSAVVVEVPETETQEVSVNVTPSAPVKEEKKRVKPKESFTTCIGGQYYYFEKGVIMDVPADVKRILMDGDMLMPL